MSSLRWYIPGIPRIMITGVMRSGTTLLHRIVEQGVLGRKPDEEFYEPRFLLEHSRDLALKGVYLNSRRELDKIFRRRWREKGRPPAIVEKDPGLVAVVEDFADIYPTAKLLISVRDPRDNLASILDVRDRLRARNEPSPITNLPDDRLADLVAAGMNAILRVKERRQALIIRYEDMASRSPEVLAELSDRLGGTFSYDLDGAHPGFGDPWVTALNNTPPTTESVGRYAQRLHHDVARYLEGITTEALREFDYRAG